MKENSTSENLKTIKIKRTINLPLSTVWKAWTEPESCQKWWGPEGFSCPACNIDFKVGGKYFNSMKGPDGKEVWATGTYLEIIPNEKIVYTDSFADSKGDVVNASYYDMPGEWPEEMLVIIDLEAEDDGTVIHLKHEGLPADQAEDCEKGWQSMFDKLERVFK